MLPNVLTGPLVKRQSFLYGCVRASDVNKSYEFYRTTNDPMEKISVIRLFQIYDFCAYYFYCVHCKKKSPHLIFTFQSGHIFRCGNCMSRPVANIWDQTHFYLLVPISILFVEMIDLIKQN